MNSLYTVGTKVMDSKDGKAGYVTGHADNKVIIEWKAGHSHNIRTTRVNADDSRLSVFSAAGFENVLLTNEAAMLRRAKKMRLGTGLTEEQRIAARNERLAAAIAA